MLTGKELFNSNMIKGALEENVQQQGVDIRIKAVNKAKGMGVIPKEGKTILPDYEEVKALHFKNKESGRMVYGWMLPAGVYDIVFEEGVEVGSGYCMKPLTRSSVVRCCARVESGLYDAGFKTDHCGAMLYVSSPILIEQGARVAQLVCLESNEVENLYNGQFQGDKQREVKK